MLEWITPNWPAPAWVKAATTTRIGGVSLPPFASLNLSLNVGDQPSAVLENRQRLRKALSLPSEPQWLHQVHGNHTVMIEDHPCEVTPEGDALYTEQTQQVCAIQTADCLPLLLCHRKKPAIAAVHAGWKGLASGVIENALQQFNCPGNELMAWLGPAIGPNAFWVQQPVVDRFVEQSTQAYSAFQNHCTKGWLANLYTLAKIRLQQAGVTAVYGGDYCTYTDIQRFFSFRRDHITGRMATLIWIETT
jgi:polyphenol oxidase